MANNDNGLDWGKIGEGALQAGIGAGIDFVGDTANSFVSNFFGKKSSKKSYERQLALMAAQYQYAQRYAENSPSWTVKGLRDAGLNPILAVGGGVHAAPAPASPSAPSAHSVSVAGSRQRYDPLTSLNMDILKAQRKSLVLDNDLKSDNLETQKALNEVKRIKAEAEASLLRPEPFAGNLEGDGKSITVYRPSESYKSMQKAIADDYDLRSEKYIRETIDAVMKYGLGILDLLSSHRRKEVLDVISTTVKKGNVLTTYTTHSPKR